MNALRASRTLSAPFGAIVVFSLTLAPLVSVAAAETQKPPSKPSPAEVQAFQQACGADAKKLCSRTAPGDGRLLKCLAAQGRSLGASCKTWFAEQDAKIRSAAQ